VSTREPVATIAVPVLNEEGSIVECLRRLSDQTVVDIEILVADGGSSDRTCELITGVARSDPRIRLLHNPRQLQAAGLNVCLNSAASPLIVRMDGHAFVEPDYVERCLQVSCRTGAAVVGGVMVPVPKPGLVPAAIALANGSWWGAGPARFHGRGRPGPAETVYLGAIRVDVARCLGGWAEDVGVNEDYEFNHRVRAAGEVVWFEPDLRVQYEPRSTLRGVLRQYFRYGRSKASVMVRYPASIRVRQLAPLCVAPMVVTTALRRRSRSAVPMAGTSAYVLLVVLAAMRTRAPLTVRLVAAVVALAMHLSWSAGAWMGFLAPIPRAGS
jgi:glycosyltransferase involved in cell wall biosynthesis